MDMVVKRSEIWLVEFDPAKGHEIKKVRPAMIVSPDVLNNFTRTVIVAPLTSSIRNLPFRKKVRFQKVDGEVALDQLRTVDRSRLVKRVGRFDIKTTSAVLETLREIFAE